MLLLGLGLRQLSMPPHQLPEIKRVIRGIRVEDARAVAAEALGQETPQAVVRAPRRGAAPRAARYTRTDYPWPRRLREPPLETESARTDRCVVAPARGRDLPETDRPESLPGRPSAPCVPRLASGWRDRRPTRAPDGPALDRVMPLPRSASDSPSAATSAWSAITT